MFKCKDKLLTNINVEFTTNFEHLDKDWHELIPKSHSLHPAFIQICEKCNLPNLDYLYVKVFKNKKPIAFFYCQILNLSSSHLSCNDPILSRINLLFFKLFKCKLLILGHLFDHNFSAVYFHSTKYTDKENFKILDKSLHSIAKKIGSAATIIKDMNAGLIPFFNHHQSKYQLINNDFMMRFDMASHWKTLSDYTEELKRKYKKRAQNILLARDKIYQRELSIEDIRLLKPQIEALYNQTINKQSFRLGKINGQYFIELLLKNSNFKICGIFKLENHQLIGFYSYFIHQHELDMFYIGIDYTLNNTYSTYFNLLFWGIEEGLKYNLPSINFGRTATDAKANLGCYATYTSNFYTIQKFSLRLLANLVSKVYYTNQTKDVDRHPFAHKP